MRIDRLAREHNVKIKWIHFPLHPETPTEGQSLEQLFAGRGKDIPAMQAQMKARMEQEGLPYGDRTMTFNSRLAQELAVWADTQPNGDGIHDALFRAYFVDGKNIGDETVLVELAESIGLSGEQARQILSERQYKDAVDQDWAKSRSYGVTGVPTYVANGRGVVGAQPYEALAALVESAKQEPQA